MTRPLVRTALSLALLLACTRSHTRPDDGAPSEAGGTPSESDGGHAPLVGDSVPCGPNRCYDGEICCHAECGLCTDPAACIPTLPCIENETVCSGVVCGGPSASNGFCCPGCEGEVCPPPGVAARAACPPPSCE